MTVDLPPRQRITLRSLRPGLLVTFAAFAATAPVMAASPQGVPLYGWQNVTVQAPYPGRDGAGLLVYDNKLWVIGGWNPSTAVFPNYTANDVWNSSDGKNWTEVKPNTFGTAAFDPSTDWEGRHMAGWVVFGNRIWIIGGDSNQCHYQPNAWASADGVHWIQATDRLPWGARVLFYTLVFNNKIWVMGGQTLLLPECPGYPQAETFYNDIWSSSDGRLWTQVTPEGPLWDPRGVIWGAVVFQGRMWMIGGGTYGTPQYLYNDVWSSADGVHWTRVLASAPWQGRIYHDIVVYDNRMWVIAGHAANGDNNLSDVWSSPDGVHWTQVPNTPWLPRHAASVAVFQGGIFITGGTTNLNGSQDDVWKLDRGPIAPLISSQLLN